ncbi:glycosyltransferase family 2 protein [Burkholderia sp. Bp8998]|uniref:glycosyltransferase n=1 Tax=Burkholderia sp. Bp8998 TaxID=2184557 RepID=UPI001639DD4D|nr:glycosyltransferase [Burkholderia sp. Bp8998]
MIWSIIVCSFNGEFRIAEALKSMFSAISDYNPDQCEIILVDNRSTDRTAAIATSISQSFPRISFSIIKEPIPGLIYARVAGMRAARGKYVSYLDDDNHPDLDYLETAERVFSLNTDVGIFGCSTRLPTNVVFPLDLDVYQRSYAVGALPFSTGILPRGNAVWGAGMAIRRAALVDILKSEYQPLLTGRSGGMQLAGDDSELAYAIELRGWRVWYERKALVVHAIDTKRMTVENLRRMYEGFGASALFLEIYRSAIRQGTPPSFFVITRALAKNVVSDVISIAKSLGYVVTRQRPRWELALTLAYTRAKWTAYGSSPERRRQQLRNIYYLLRS